MWLHQLMTKLTYDQISNPICSHKSRIIYIAFLHLFVNHGTTLPHWQCKLVKFFFSFLFHGYTESFLKCFAGWMCNSRFSGALALSIVWQHQQINQVLGALISQLLLNHCLLLSSRVTKTQPTLPKPKGQNRGLFLLLWGVCISVLRSKHSTITYHDA